MESKKVKRRILWAVIAAAAMICVSNLGPIPLLLGEPIIHVYRYESSDGGFDDIEVPEKGRNLNAVEELFARYKNDNPKAILYRTSHRQPWKFWCWFDYLSNPRWDYEYRHSNL